MTEPITFNLSDIDQPNQSQPQQNAPQATSPSQPMTFHVSDIDAPTSHGASGSWDQSAESADEGEQFKSQAWRSAGHNLIHGNLRAAASDVGSLFTTRNPAAVEAATQLG